MNRVKIARSSLYVIIIVIIVFAVFSAYLLYRIHSLDSFYSFKTTYQNISGLCTTNESTMILFYGSNCPSCQLEDSAFTNVTASFNGSWLSQDQFRGLYFCAYKVNLTQYNADPSSLQAPAASVQIFAALSTRVPTVFIGGLYTQYYKIGGFTSASSAESQLLHYMCASINYVAPACASIR